MVNCIEINESKCVGCGLCEKDCTHHAIRVMDGKAHMIAESCMECGHCVAICPKKAVSMNGYDMNEVKEYNADKFDISADIVLNRIKFRRSVRQFKKQAVEKEKIEQIIEAGRFTPTGSNKQKIRYVVMENPEEKIEDEAVKTFKKVVSLAKIISKFVSLPHDVSKYHVERGFFFHGAPTVIFVISEDEVDASLASTNMENMAEAEGLGVFYVGLFVRAARLNKKICTQLRMTKKEKLVTVIAIGYPKVKYQRTVPRKKADIEWR